MLTFLDSTKDYKLYDEQNRVVTTQKGTELYTCLLYTSEPPLVYDAKEKSR